MPAKAVGFSVIMYMRQGVCGTYNCGCNPDITVTYCVICCQNKSAALKNAGDSRRQIRSVKKLETMLILNKRYPELEEGQDYSPLHK